MEKKLKNRYFILRHGQTIYQVKKKKQVYNWPDKPPVRLTKKGERQIKKAAKMLKGEKIDLIYSSDIFRTRQTAKIVSKEIGLKVSFDKRLRDINLGVYHGRLKKEFYYDFPNRKKRFDEKPPKGESWNDVRKRLLIFLGEIDKKYRNKNILIISHGDPLWLLEGIIKKLSNEKLLKKASMGNYIKVGEFRKL
jgi:broad specificity phosphatase PhoE